jgi:hypothetical protein
MCLQTVAVLKWPRLVFEEYPNVTAKLNASTTGLASVVYVKMDSTAMDEIVYKTV